VNLGNLRALPLLGLEMPCAVMMPPECWWRVSCFTGHAPENVTGELRKFSPNLIILIDAAEMRAVPGTICWVPIQSIEGMSASTHSLPLSMLARYLTLELNCVVTLIGIQPKSNEVSEIISAEVSRAINEIVDEICNTCFALKSAS
jgi:hydrogenase 3 maturation protease